MLIFEDENFAESQATPKSTKITSLKILYIYGRTLYTELTDQSLAICVYAHTLYNTLEYKRTTCKMIAPAVPTIARVATGARTLMANTIAVAVTDNKAIVIMKKKNLPASGSKPNVKLDK